MTKVTADLDAADLLDAASDYLRTHGWIQGWSGGHGNPRRAVGALSSAYDGAAALPGAWDGAIASMQRAVAPHADRISSWNDQDGRTRDEVIDKLMDAAARI